METLEAPTIALEGDNPSMTLADAQQQRLLERLREGAATSRSLLPSCTPAGIDFPASVISELELNGY